MRSLPQYRGFAFTVVDDTDGSTVENIGPVYKLLDELRVRTTKSVWVLPCVPGSPFAGSTLQDPEYLDFVHHLQQQGFEIALHNVRNQDAERECVRRGLDEFERLLGVLPRIHANHFFNRENLYWGTERLGLRWMKWVYGKTKHGRYQSEGHVERSPYFWGDLCQQHISYVRNFVFGGINLDRVHAAVPYHDPQKPFVNYWFSSCEGGNVARFCDTISERNQDQLEAARGVCIMYAHFSQGFVEHGQVNPRFEYLMRRLAAKNGWFVPASCLLDHLRRSHAGEALSYSQRVGMETSWALHKLSLGAT